MRSHSVFVAVVVIGAFALIPASHADGGDEALGCWLTDDGSAIFEIYTVDGKYHGKIVWLKEPNYPKDDKEAGKPVRDRENPDASKRDRPLLGLELLRDFDYAGDNAFENGHIYNPDNGKTYKCKMKLAGGKELHVRGYIGISLIGGTTVWTRCEKPASPDSQPSR